MIEKRLIDPIRVRRPPLEGFSWVDRRFMRDCTETLGRDEILLYLFLAAVSDKNGISYWGDTKTSARLKLDPSKEPKAVDMIKSVPGSADEVIKGIYTFENDTLKICRGLNASQERPNQFATWPDTNYFVVTWKKQAK